MKWSAPEAALVPLEVATVTSTVPAGPAGDVAVTWVAELTRYEVAASVPSSTELAPRNPVPVMMTVLAPVKGPAGGLTAETVGAAW